MCVIKIHPEEKRRSHGRRQKIPENNAKIREYATEPKNNFSFVALPNFGVKKNEKNSSKRH